MKVRLNKTEWTKVCNRISIHRFGTMWVNNAAHSKFKRGSSEEESKNRIK